MGGPYLTCLNPVEAVLGIRRTLSILKRSALLHALTCLHTYVPPSAVGLRRPAGRRSTRLQMRKAAYKRDYMENLPLQHVSQPAPL
jgi:hypothetical protein